MSYIPIPKDMPCRRDCPDRAPGCFCDKKKAWNASQEAKKQQLFEAKKKDSMVLEVRNPERAKKARKT